MSDNPNIPGRGTLAVHAGVEPDPTTGAIMTPVYLTSTYVQDGVGNHKGFEYSRTHNPTRSALQDAFAALEHGKHGIGGAQINANDPAHDRKQLGSRYRAFAPLSKPRPLQGIRNS